MPEPGTAEHAPLSAIRTRAVLLGAAAVIGLAFMIPYFNYTLNKYDWAFRPLATGPVFLLFILALPVNTLLRRLRPNWAFTGPELLLVYAMMAICAALANEGLYGYVTENSAHPAYFATPENRWARTFLPNVPLWLQVNQPEAARWFYEGIPPGVAIPWGQWTAPVLSWSVFALALYAAFFSLGCLMRKDWIEGQRLAFPIAALPIEMAGDQVPSAASSFFRNPLLWIGVSLPVLQSLVQLAHNFAPSVPYSPLYFNIGRSFAGNGPWDSISDTYAYIGFETIGILALMPADVSLSLWLFFLVDRLQILTFSALGYGQGGAGVFNPSAFITYQEAGGALMLAVILIWQSRRAITGAARSLLGRPQARDPLDPIPPGAAIALLVVSLGFMAYWTHCAGMDLWVFGVLMTIFFGYSLATARLVSAGGVFVPDVSMNPRDLMVGVTGAAGFTPGSLTMITYLQATFMQEWKVNFLHFDMNDMKILHSARVRGRLAAGALLLALLLMMAVVPWVNIHTAYAQGAQKFDSWQFRDMGNYQFGQLSDSLRTPEAATPFLSYGLVCGAAVMLLLTWLHTNFLWWGVSPIGFIMGGTWGLNTRLWTNAFIAWALVVLMIRFGGLRMYRKFRPAFLGMALGHFLIMGLRSITDPMLGLFMQLSPWS
ncbi:MAG: DUF6785 family protein [Armatimonadota bacterium]|jgi:hypothetical protein